MVFYQTNKQTNKQTIKQTNNQTNTWFAAAGGDKAGSGARLGRLPSDAGGAAILPHGRRRD